MPHYIRTLLIVLVVVLISIFLVWPTDPGIHLFGINIDIKTHLGLDLVGGVQALLEADVPATTEVTTDAMGAAVQIVENRVNGLGLNEALVQQSGNRRIVVELPGEKDPEKALKSIRETGLLEFVDMSDIPAATVYQYENDKVTITTDFATGGTAATPTAVPQPTITPTTAITPTDTTANATVVPTPTVVPTGTTTTPAQVFHTVMTGARLKTVQPYSNEAGQWEISFELDTEGAQIFKDYTTANTGTILAIVLDKKIISAPTIQNPITDGKGVITGSFTYESANTLVTQLRYGALPIPLKIVESRTVGPTLGEDSLRKSLIAGLVGFTIVFMFMGLYYRLPGLVANVAILIYALLTYALFRSIPITLTLPGIAGFMLSTGSALDANILIFERMKEELRNGKTIRQAIDLGIKRAWPSIRDSNIATFLTCLILFWFGSAFGATIVKGFSLTLLIGIITSLFTAMVVSRALLYLTFENLKITNLKRWFGI